MWPASGNNSPRTEERGRGCPEGGPSEPTQAPPSRHLARLVGGMVGADFDVISVFPRSCVREPLAATGGIRCDAKGGARVAHEWRMTGARVALIGEAHAPRFAPPFVIVPFLSGRHE